MQGVGEGCGLHAPQVHTGHEDLRGEEKFAVAADLVIENEAGAATAGDAGAYLERVVEARRGEVVGSYRAHHETQALLDEQGLGFVVRSVQADYRASARLDDALEVITQVAMLRRASILFEQQLVRGQELLFTARVLLASIDLRRQKPVAIPASLHALLESKA